VVLLSSRAAVLVHDDPGASSLAWLLGSPGKPIVSALVCHRSWLGRDGIGLHRAGSVTTKGLFRAGPPTSASTRANGGMWMTASAIVLRPAARAPGPEPPVIWVILGGGGGSGELLGLMALCEQMLAA